VSNSGIFSLIQPRLEISIPPRPLDRLAAAILINRQNPNGAMMALFSAAFDASGDGKRHPFVIVSGLVANFQQWGLFEKLWIKAHEEADVHLPLHTADLMAAINQPKYSIQSNARPDYVQLARNPERAKLFIHHLAVAAVTTISCGISCIVPMDLYGEVNSLLGLREKVPPYALGARMCLASLHEWEVFVDIAEPVDCIFESGDFEQGRLTSLLEEEHHPAPIYRKKEELLGLQGADFYAWEQFNFMRQRSMNVGYVPTESSGWLINGIPKLHVQPTHATLINLCEKKGVKPRE
jgi:hypothetical protein